MKTDAVGTFLQSSVSQEDADTVIQLCADRCSSPNITLLEDTAPDFCSLTHHIYWIGTNNLAFEEFSTDGLFLPGRED